MGKEGEGLTLQGLAKRMEAQTQRLEALERENERMRSENARLMGRVTTLEGSATMRGGEPAAKRTPREAGRREGVQGSWTVTEAAVSRREMLSKAGAAAVAAMAAGTLLAPRRAEAESVTFGDVYTKQLNVRPEDGRYAVGVTGNSSTPAVQIENFRGAAVEANGYGGDGVQGYGGDTGVKGSGGNTGVYGQSRSSGGRGVEGLGDDIGVFGRATSDSFGTAGVYGVYEGDVGGDGVAGDGKGAGRAGVFGRNASGAGVEGGGSRYGGKFAGSRAPLLLVPKGSADKPTSGSHTKGEIYLDSAATVFVCTRSGTPGTWRKVTTTSA